MALWNGLYFHPGVRHPIADRSDAWNRGAYLVEGAGHCGACHTPKRRLGGDDLEAALEGGEIQGWMSPNLNGDRRTGLGTWSETDIVTYLQAGTNAHAAASGPMAEVISKSTSRMSDADLQAIAEYLKTRDGDPHDVGHPLVMDDTTSRIGESIYVDACAPCHAPTGEGVERLFPPLKGSSIVQAQNPATLIRVVLHGTQNVATDRAPTGASMPAFGWKLDDAQVAAVLTYVRNHWGNTASPVAASAVQLDRTAANGGPRQR
jgi:mono/diheme cytochrome c family protein